MRLARQAVIGLGVVLVGCTEPNARVADRSSAPPPAAVCERSRGWDLPRVDVVAEGLDTPWAMTVAPDGRVFLTERRGMVRVIVDGTLRPEPWAELPVAHVGESGLLGIAPAPDYAATGALFVAGVYPRRSRALPMRVLRRALRGVGVDPGTDFVLRVHRLRPDGVGLDSSDLVVDGIPASAIHPGGVIHFVDDSTFLLTVGDSMDPWTAQAAGDPRGSILRFRVPSPGAVLRPKDARSAVASGVRNPQAVVQLSLDGTLGFLDHGPTGTEVEGGRTGRDEFNVLVAGGNYGWPAESGIHPGAASVAPIHEWTDGIAPAGATAMVVADTTMVFVTGLRGQTLRRLELARHEGGGWSVLCESTVLEGTYGRLRAVVAHPDGGVLVATSNRDSRGVPGPADDRVLWLRPAGTQ